MIVEVVSATEDMEAGRGGAEIEAAVLRQAPMSELIYLFIYL